MGDINAVPLSRPERLQDQQIEGALEQFGDLYLRIDILQKGGSLRIDCQ